MLSYKQKLYVIRHHSFPIEELVSDCNSMLGRKQLLVSVKDVVDFLITVNKKFTPKKVKVKKIRVKKVKIIRIKRPYNRKPAYVNTTDLYDVNEYRQYYSY